MVFLVVMGFLSDFLFELILTLLFDGSVEIVKNKKLNICLRVAAAVFMIAIIAGVLLAVLVAGIIVTIKGQWFSGGIVIALASLMIALAVKKFISVLKKNKT